VQQASDRGTGAVDGDVTAALTGAANTADERAEAGGVEERDAGEVDQHALAAAQLREGFAEVANGERVELTDGAAHDVIAHAVDRDVEQRSILQIRVVRRVSAIGGYVPCERPTLPAARSGAARPCNYPPAVPEVLVVTDATWVVDDIAAAIGGPDITIRSVSAGVDLLPAVQSRVPDLVVLDLQVGNMGGMAACLNLRLEEGAGRLEHVPVLMLLDRRADVFLARRSDVDGWLVKPLDALRTRKAVRALLDDGRYEDATGAPATVPPVAVG
jgi:CheY-like chemotaxis protein